MLGDLLLAPGDQAQGDRLHAAGALGVFRDLSQGRADHPADDPVEDATRLLRVDESRRQIARFGDGLLHFTLGNRVKDDSAVGVLADEFADMPGDRLAFAVGIHREQNFLGVFRERFQLRDRARRAIDHLVGHNDLPVLEFDRQIAFRRQVPHMSERGGDAVVGSEKAPDLFDLVRRFDDDELQGDSVSLSRRSSSDATRFSSSVMRSSFADAGRGADDDGAGGASPENR